VSAADQAVAYLDDVAFEAARLADALTYLALMQVPSRESGDGEGRRLRDARHSVRDRIVARELLNGDGDERPVPTPEEGGSG